MIKLKKPEKQEVYSFFLPDGKVLHFTNIKKARDFTTGLERGLNETLNNRLNYLRLLKQDYLLSLPYFDLYTRKQLQLNVSVIYSKVDLVLSRSDWENGLSFAFLHLNAIKHALLQICEILEKEYRRLRNSILLKQVRTQAFLIQADQIRFERTIPHYNQLRKVVNA